MSLQTETASIIQKSIAKRCGELCAVDGQLSRNDLSIFIHELKAMQTIMGVAQSVAPKPDYECTCTVDAQCVGCKLEDEAQAVKEAM